MQAVRQLRGAVKAQDQPEGGKVSASMAKVPLPQRPLRRVIPPTLTPQEIDRLLGEYLAKTNPKVEPAALTSDVEFVRRVYFDLAGVPPTPAQVALLRQRSRPRTSGPRLIDALLAEPRSTPATGPATGAT